jgi:hypothetical protein
MPTQHCEIAIHLPGYIPDGYRLPHVGYPNCIAFDRQPFPAAIDGRQDTGQAPEKTTNN